MTGPSSPGRVVPARYNGLAQLFHWLTAAALVGAFALGLTMVELDMTPLKLRMYSWHKWLGVCLWGLVLLRLIWRWWRPPPPLPVGMPAWQQRVASVTHALLYVLLLLVPLSGWAMSSAQGFPTVLFGYLPLPDLVPANERLGDVLAEVHWWLNKSLLALALLHIGAALKHQFIDRDGLLWRMLPGRRSAPAPEEPVP